MQGANSKHDVWLNQILNTLVRKIVDIAQPLRIILFGSAAEGRMGPESDLDVLVVVQDGRRRRRTAQAIYKGLSGLGIPKDIIVVTESDLREHKDNPALVISRALEKGRELYHAPRSQ